jgi:hypothetical protein
MKKKISLIINSKKIKIFFLLFLLLNFLFLIYFFNFSFKKNNADIIIFIDQTYLNKNNFNSNLNKKDHFLYETLACIQNNKIHLIKNKNFTFNEKKIISSIKLTGHQFVRRDYFQNILLSFSFKKDLNYSQKVVFNYINYCENYNANKIFGNKEYMQNLISFKETVAYINYIFLVSLLCFAFTLSVFVLVLYSSLLNMGFFI